MSAIPRISFGMIVLNGEPFLRYNLRALYPYAHQIIVVEGAAPGARNIATSDGHSRDSTLETLRRFQQEEDPDGKLLVITRDGFWTEKNEMSQAYAERATGDYLWQIDVDEFYLPRDMERVIAMLQADPTISAMSFKMLTFWGAPDIRVDGWFLRRGADQYHRLFKWGEGYQYVTHRPPTVHDAQGRDTRSLHWLDPKATAAQGICLYHYSLLFPKQVIEKCDYYVNSDWMKLKQMQDWANESYLQLKRPYRVHNWYEMPGWLERFRGEYPPQIAALWQDTLAGRTSIEPRQNDDAEKLLRSPRYALGRFALKWLDYADRNRFLRRVWRWLNYRVLARFAARKDTP